MNETKIMMNSLDKTKDMGKYWKNMLEENIDRKSFQVDFREEAVYQKRSLRFELDIDLYKKIIGFTKDENLSTYVFMLSILKLQLFKCSNQSNLIVGIPVYFKSDYEKIPNEIIFCKSLLNETMSYKEALLVIKDAVLESYKNQIYPLEQLLKENNIDDIMSILPISFAMKNIHSHKHIENITSSFKNEITFLISKECDTILVELIYNAQLFAESTIRRIYSMYIHIMSQVLDRFEIKISEIEILTEQEKKQVLFDFNNTSVSYVNDKTIQELFEDKVKKSPNNIAILFQDKQITYKEINERSNSLANVLREKGVQANTIVGIMVDRSIEMIIGIMAILKAGGAYLPLDPKHPKDRIEYMVEDSSSKLLLISEELLNNVELNIELINLSNEDLYVNKTTNLDKINDSKDLAYVIYTSGSTGQPKGVMIEHSSAVNTLTYMQKKYPLSNNDVYLLKTSYSFDVSVSELFGWIFGDGKLAILEKDGEKDINSLINAINKYKVTHLNFVPSMLKIFNDINEDSLCKLKSIKYIFSAGEEIKANEVNNFYNKFHWINLENLYGPTETTIYCTNYSLISDLKYNKMPIGKPIDNTEIYIVNNNKLMPIGIPGELCISGFGLARGYLNRTKLTSERFVDNPFKSGTKMYKTGDLARWMADGNIEFLGRIDNQVKVQGYRIELGEVESNLLKHDGIKEAVVIDKDDSEGSKYLCAYIILQKEITSNILREHLGKTLPKYMIPTQFIRIERLPLLSNGKIDRKALLALDERLDLGIEYSPPTNETEQKLVEIWREVLGIDKVGIQDNFFEIGGVSIKVFKVLQLIKNEFRVEISANEFYEMPIIRCLAQKIDLLINTIDINGLNNEISDKFNKRALIKKVIAEQNEFFILYSDKEIITDVVAFLKAKYNNRTLPDYILEYDESVISTKNSVEMKIEELDIMVRLHNVDEDAMKGIINISNKNCKKLETIFSNKEIVKAHEIGYLLNDKCDRKSKHRGLIRHFIIDFNGEIDQNSINNKLIKFINEQIVLRMTVSNENGEYIFLQYEEINELGLEVIDISKYSYQSKKAILEKITCGMLGKMLSTNFTGNLLYNLNIVKLTGNKYLILMCIDDLISDNETKRIIKECIINSENTENTASYTEYIKKIYCSDVSERFERFNKSNILNEYLKAAELFHKKHEKYDDGVAISLSKPYLIDLEYENINTELFSEYDSPMKIGLLISLKVISILFDIESIPLRIFMNKRIYGSENYYYTLGDFTDSIPCTFKIESSNQKNYYEEYIKIDKQLSDENIQLKGLIRDIEWSMPIYRYAPFTFSYLGQVPFLDKDSIYSIGYTGSIPYPVVAYSISSSRLIIVFQNGFNEEKVNEIKLFLDSLGAKVKVITK